MQQHGDTCLAWILYSGGGARILKREGEVQGWVKISKSATKIEEYPALPCLCQKNSENWAG